MSTLASALQNAYLNRVDFIDACHAEKTSCYRLFHGATEGCPGLTVDRYGMVVLAQTWREPVNADVLGDHVNRLSDRFERRLVLVVNHRGVRSNVSHSNAVELPEKVSGNELGLRFNVHPRHPGIDPLLFLDFRAARRWVRAHSKGKTVLNLFSYTCGIGIAAVAGGAERAINVDFTRRALDVGLENARLNKLDMDRFQILPEDAICVLRQYSGLGVKGKAARRRFTRVKPRQFDLVVMDPPRLANSPFGKVDLVNDYQTLFKPALLSTRPGGTLLVSNNVSSVKEEQWHDALKRCAEKAGRPILNLKSLPPEADFPSPDGQHPLKIALIQA